MNPLVIILNGPSRIGKNVLSDLIVREFGTFVKVRFKDFLIYEVLEKYLMTRTEWNISYTKKMREQPHPRLRELSPVEALIQMRMEISESGYGRRYLGILAGEYIEDGCEKVYIFSDGGSVEEIKALAEYNNNVLIIRLHKDGYTFAGDDREYVYIDEEDWSIKGVDIQLVDNNESEAVDQITKAISEYVAHRSVISIFSFDKLR